MRDCRVESVLFLATCAQTVSDGICCSPCRSFISRKEGPYPWTINWETISDALSIRNFNDKTDLLLSKMNLKVCQPFCSFDKGAMASCLHLQNMNMPFSSLLVVKPVWSRWTHAIHCELFVDLSCTVPCWRCPYALSIPIGCLLDAVSEGDSGRHKTECLGLVLTVHREGESAGRIL